VRSDLSRADKGAGHVEFNEIVPAGHGSPSRHPAVSGVSRGIGTSIGVDIDFPLFAPRRADTATQPGLFTISGCSRRDS